MRFPSVSFLADAFAGVWRRFPLAMLAALTGVVAVVLLIADYDKQTNDFCVEIALAATLALPLFIAATTWTEKLDWGGPKKWLLPAIGLLIVAVYYLTLDISTENEGLTTVITFLALNLVAHLLVGVAPYLDRTSVDDFWEYNKRLFVNFVIGAFYSLVIFAGLSIAIVAVDNLFDLHINNKIYGYLFVVVAGIINTSFFLSQMPVAYAGIADVESQYTLAIKNLLKYILIPIVGIYFLILYAYTAKILFTWNLPKGWVGSLVLGFSVAGIFTYLLNYLLVRFDESAIVRGYRRWFFFVLLPMVALLFVAVGRRLSDYGVTEPRFIVSTAGVWLAVVSLYFIISRKDNIKFIPISLGLFALLSVMGPFSAFSVSSRSQTARLQHILEQNSMWRDGKAVAATTDIADAEHIRSILSYMREYGHFRKVASWFDGAPDTDYPNWEDIQRIMDTLHLQSGTPSLQNCEYFFETEPGLGVSGYDYLWNIEVYEDSEKPKDFSGFALSADKGSLQFFEKDTLLDTYALDQWLTGVQAQYPCFEKRPPIAAGTLELAGTRHDIKLVTEMVSFKQGKPNTILVYRGKALVRKRE
jgi:hypothetical protein